MVRVYMQELLIMNYGYEMEDSWNNLVTRSWDEAQEKVFKYEYYPIDCVTSDFWSYS